MNFPVTRKQLETDLSLLMTELNGIGLKQAEVNILLALLEAGTSGENYEKLQEHLDNPPVASTLSSQISRIRGKLGQNPNRKDEVNKCFVAQAKCGMKYWLHIADVVDGKPVFFQTGGVKNRKSEKQLCIFTTPIPGEEEDLIPLTTKSFVTLQNEVDADSPPEFFHLPYLEKRVEDTYGKDTGFLVVRYGSSVKQDEQPHDEDYLVLIHGNKYVEDETSKDQIGGTNVAVSPFDRPIDISIQLFDSFFIALIIGKPYEVSIAVDGEVEEACNMSDRYWNWLKVMASNMTYNRDYLIKQLQDDLTKYINAYKQSVDDYSIVISSYMYICTLIQVFALKKMDNVLNGHDIYPLSKAENLSTYVEDKITRQYFYEFVSIFKKIVPMPDKDSIVFKVRNLVNRLEQELG